MTRLRFVEQFTLHLALRTCTDAMNRIDQQVDEIVCQATRSQVDERGQPGDARWRWVPAKFVRRLHRYTPSAEFEICQFFLQAGEAWAPWTALLQTCRRRVVVEQNGGSPHDSALARWSCSSAMASVRAHGPRPKARSTILASPTMPPWRANSPSLTLAQRPHDLEALDRGVGRLQRLESAHGPEQQLELAVVGLDDVVEVLHLPVPRLVRAFALGFQLCDGAGVGRRLVGVQHLGLLPILQPVQRLAEESLRGLGVAGRREIEIERVPELVERTVQIRPLAADLDVGLVDAPAPRPGPAPLPAQAPLHFRGDMLNPAIERRVVDCDAAFGHHRFEIPVADRVPAVPEHDLTAEVASLEIPHAPTPRSSQRRQFTDSGRFLQQSPEGHAKARLYDQAAADNYIKHTTIGDPVLDPIMDVMLVS